MKKNLLLILLITFSKSAFSQISFNNKEITSFSEGAKCKGDIDGDGDIDIVSLNFNSLDLYKNKFPEDGFSPKQILSNDQFSVVTFLDLSDFDNDGDLDILVSDKVTDKIFWYQNLNGQGVFGTKQILKTIDMVGLVRHIDMDNDGDKDLLYVAGDGWNYGYQIAYFENANLPNNYTILHSVNNINTATEFFFKDLDNDNDIDVFLYSDTTMSCIKNNGNGNFSNITSVVSPSNHIYKLDIADIDNDNDNDLVGYVENSVGNRKIVYHLNDGLCNFGVEQIIRQNITPAYAIKVADLDGDSYKDIVVSIKNTNYEYYSDILWFKNSGAYTFTTMPNIDGQVRQLSTIDAFNIDNDSDVDIFTTSANSRTTTYTNNGTGTFNPPKYPTAYSSAVSCAVAGDVDNDGDLDVVNASYEEGKIFLYKKITADNTYGNQLIISHIATGAKEVALADLDGDTDLDIISISGLSDTGSEDKVSWYKNLDGNGNFGPQINIPIGTYASPDGLLVYDVDADGDKDIVTSITQWPDDGDKVIWFSNNGLGSFSSQLFIGNGLNKVKSISKSDIDNDGDNDIIVASSNDNKISWYKNLNGQGSFGPQQIITTSALYVVDFSIADLDNDGKKDIIYMSNSDDDNILWQRNTDGLGTFGTPQIINSNVHYNGASAIYAADIDNDTDIDIVVGEYGKTTWLENLYGQAVFNPPVTIFELDYSDPSSSQLIDLDNDNDLDILMAYKGLSKIICHENLGVTRNRIKGEVRLDVQGNNCDSTDALLPNIMVKTTNGTTTQATLTLRNEFAGQYQLFTDQGNYQTSLVGNLPNYFVLNPSNHSSTFVGYGNTDIDNFCIEPIGQINDLSTVIYPLSEARPGFSAKYLLIYRNIGTTTLSGQVSFNYNNSKIQFVSGSVIPDSQTVNSLNFNFSNLAPFEIKTVVLNFNVFDLPITSLGDNLVFTSTINTPNDYTPVDNTFNLNQTIIGSYDPNDITCLEGHQVLIQDANKYLHYVIRFQNTGTASAINVTVKQTLDSKVDWTTFQLEGMSHNGSVQIKDGSLLEFNFNNIQLPDSTTDEAGSHGYITFKIKPKSNVVVGNIVNATAGIYFDNNPPVITNTYSTEFINLLGVKSFESENISVYPNPFGNYLQIESKVLFAKMMLYDVAGKQIFSQNFSKIIDTTNLEQGMYLLHLITEENEVVVKKVIKE